METIKINKRICIEAKCLTKNIKKFLLQKILDQTKDECSPEIGYITNVKEILSFNSSISNANSDNIFSVELLVETLKPVKNSKYDGVVCMVFDKGIFLAVCEKLKILVPISLLAEKYKFNPVVRLFGAPRVRARMVPEISNYLYATLL